MYTTVHTRGIVNHNTTHHGTAYRSRIGREYATIGLKDFIHPATHNTGLQFDGLFVLCQFIFLPMLAGNYQHAVRTTLS